ncbi:hypothetical protein DEHRE_06180 [Dehalobacter restrictus DSM 9455]|uniref:Uncharacterized protein n=1 Tax=Dehalobacter restrictus (strain DSM 9455 / PER-K23) TaxID=871738 RepID=A0ABM5P9D5_DEHRP|nr:hypothetical protein DEHRE_06180 [Dehalobacter restrictus DSM 9455]
MSENKISFLSGSFLWFGAAIFSGSYDVVEIQ